VDGFDERDGAFETVLDGVEHQVVVDDRTVGVRQHVPELDGLLQPLGQFVADDPVFVQRSDRRLPVSGNRDIFLLEDRFRDIEDRFGQLFELPFGGVPEVLIVVGYVVLP
jgi:hypothetical protein